MYLQTNYHSYFKQSDLNSGKGEVLNFDLPGSQDYRPMKAGYGACYKCPCKGFEGNGQQCSNCGHSFSDHW